MGGRKPGDRIIMRVDGENIRTFICFEIPKKIQRTIYREVTLVLKKCRVRCSWVKPENIHLTLKFLGDVPEKRIGGISEKIRWTLEGFAPVELRLDSVGTFGKKSPRVVWIGVAGETDPLVVMAKAVDNVLARIGFPAEKRVFSPHLTIGRIRDPRGADDLLRSIEGIELDPVEFTVHRIILMKSELSPRGSIYSPLELFEL